MMNLFCSIFYAASFLLHLFCCIFSVAIYLMKRKKFILTLYFTYISRKSIKHNDGCLNIIGISDKLLSLKRDYMFMIRNNKVENR
jgi:hypothetical protein